MKVETETVHLDRGWKRASITTVAPVAKRGLRRLWAMITGRPLTEFTEFTASIYVKDGTAVLIANPKVTEATTS